jgi:hypothetical protein
LRPWKRNGPRATELVLLLLAGSCLRADGLGDLRLTLKRLQGSEPVKATLDYQFWRQVSEPGGPVTIQGGATTRAEDGPQGLRVTWERATLQAADAEQRASALAPFLETPTAQILRSLSALDIAEHLNEGQTLDRLLLQATLLETRQGAWLDKPATVLVVRIAPLLTPPSLRRAVKEVTARAEVWLGADGTPLAYHSDVSYKGSRYLIHFQGVQTEEIHFVRSGNRLVASWASNEERQSGLGQSLETRRVYRISLN